MELWILFSLFGFAELVFKGSTFYDLLPSSFSLLYFFVSFPIFFFDTLSLSFFSGSLYFSFLLLSDRKVKNRYAHLPLYFCFMWKIIYHLKINLPCSSLPNFYLYCSTYVIAIAEFSNRYIQNLFSLTQRFLGISITSEVLKMGVAFWK